MGQCRESGHVQCGEEDAAGDPDSDIVVLGLVLVTVCVPRHGVIDPEDDDQARGGLEKLLLPVRTERRRPGEPFSRGPRFVKLALFLFGGVTNLSLDVGVADDDESPRLEIRAGWG